MTWTERLRMLARRLVDARPMTEDEQREAGAGLLGLLESPSLAHPLRDLSDEDVARLLATANGELRRRSHGAGWLSLEAAARRLGLAKGSVHHAVTKGRLRARRLLPVATDHPSSVVLLLHPDDVAAYRPRTYPRARTPEGA